MPNRRYYLAVQITLPPNYRDDPEFAGDMKLLQELEFDGVELNIAAPLLVNQTGLREFLADFGLTMSMFASGAAAKAGGLSLAATDDGRRREAVRRSVEFLEFAAQFGAGVIAGFLKGPLDHSTSAHREQLRRSIAELVPHTRRLTTPLLVEAINRFESPLGHTLDEVWSLIEQHECDYLQVLPDTWHMNIEESTIEAAIVRHRGHFGSFHLSDSNRCFPGYGALNFRRVIDILGACGYHGKLAIEGTPRRSFREDLAYSVRTLDPYLR